MTRRSHGHAIFLNGIPSSGKSTVAAEIRRRTPSFRLLTGDDVIRQVPEAQRLAQVDRIFALTLDMIDTWLQSSNVIVDGAWTQKQVADAQARFGDRGLYVVLRIDEAERKRRESLRRDRVLPWWDPSWHAMPGPDDLYDLVVDAKVTSASNSAERILEKAKEAWGKQTVR